LRNDETCRSPSAGSGSLGVARAELLAKDMQQTGREAFLGWLRTTWFPYTDRLRWSSEAPSWEARVAC